MLRISPLFMAALLLGAPLAAHADVDVSLRGSRASMLRQNRIAKGEDYSFLRTAAQVRDFVDSGYLEPLDGNRDYDVIAGYPFARPVVRAFIERLSSRYREACDEKLVVTSLTRPATNQPRNASPLSVHPAGMAVDLRVSGNAACREWLSSELLALEEMGLLDATLEKRPPHYHVAVFPAPFAEYDAAQRAAEEAERARLAAEEAAAAAAAAVDMEVTADTSVASRDASSLMLRIAAVVALLFLPMVV